MQMLSKIPGIGAFIILGEASWNVYDGPIFCNSDRNNVFFFVFHSPIFNKIYVRRGVVDLHLHLLPPHDQKTGSRGLAPSRKLFMCLLKKFISL